MSLISFANIITAWYDNKIKSIRKSVLILLFIWNAYMGVCL